MKLVDPRGEMLESSWERHATALANAPSTVDFVNAVDKLVKDFKINLDHEANVLYARDTRPSGEALVAALEDGLKAMGAKGRNEGVQTTPILHYLVRCVNTKGTPEAYGEDTVEGYIKSISNAFKKLTVRLIILYLSRILLFLSYISGRQTCPPSPHRRLCQRCRLLGPPEVRRRFEGYHRIHSD